MNTNLTLLLNTINSDLSESDIDLIKSKLKEIKKKSKKSKKSKKNVSLDSEVQRSIVIPKGLFNSIEKICETSGMSITDFCIEAIVYYTTSRDSMIFDKIKQGYKILDESDKTRFDLATSSINSTHSCVRIVKGDELEKLRKSDINAIIEKYSTTGGENSPIFKSNQLLVGENFKPVGYSIVDGLPIYKLDNHNRLDELDEIYNFKELNLDIKPTNTNEVSNIGPMFIDDNIGYVIFKDGLVNNV